MWSRQRGEKDMMWFILPVFGVVTLFTANASAQDFRYYLPDHDRYHDELEHREFHRELDHRDAHRYPMTWQQHEQLHDDLDHEAFHDRLDHRQYHREYDSYSYGYSPYAGQYYVP